MPDPTPVALEELYDDTHRRLLHSGDTWTGQPYALLDDSAIELAAGNGDRPNHGIGITAEFGTQITGPMSFPRCRRTSVWREGTGASTQWP
jgi:hypothetical protein